jgi:hypothetical protein
MAQPDNRHLGIGCPMKPNTPLGPDQVNVLLLLSEVGA